MLKSSRKLSAKGGFLPLFAMVMCGCGSGCLPIPNKDAMFSLPRLPLPGPSVIRLGSGKDPTGSTSYCCTATKGLLVQARKRLQEL